MIAYRTSKYRMPYEVRADIRFTGKVYCVDVEVRKFGETKWAKAHTFRCRKYKVAQQAHRELVGEVWI